MMCRLRDLRKPTKSAKSRTAGQQGEQNTGHKMFEQLVIQLTHYTQYYMTSRGIQMGFVLEPSSKRIADM
jgi:hypothetical protein